MLVLLVAVLGMLILVITVVAYPLLGHFGPGFSTNSSEWANFGNYLGGVAGPLLSFLALVAVAWTVRLQYDLLLRDGEKQRVEQQVRWLEAIYRDIVDLLNAPVHSVQGQEPTSVWAVLHGEAKRTTGNPVVLKERLEELLKLITQYCKSVALYRENVSEFFDAQIFQDRGARILDRLKPFLPVIGPNAAIAIEFCDMHLRGETKRKNAEALRRNTRI